MIPNSSDFVGRNNRKAACGNRFETEAAVEGCGLIVGSINNHANPAAADDGLMRQLTGAGEQHCPKPFTLMLDSHGELSEQYGWNRLVWQPLRGIGPRFGFNDDAGPTGRPRPLPGAEDFAFTSIGWIANLHSAYFSVPIVHQLNHSDVLKFALDLARRAGSGVTDEREPCHVCLAVA